MSIALRNVLVAAALLAGCSPTPNLLVRDPSFVREEGTVVAVLPVFDHFGGIDTEDLRRELVVALHEIRCRGVGVNPADRPSGEWTPARASLAAREAGAQAALLVSLLPSDRPIHPRAPEDAFGRPIGPTPVPGRWLWSRVIWVDARDARIMVRADTELKEAGLSTFRLARILLGPLES